MIGLGLRLALAGGREAITRLALIVTAVAIGVGLLLSTFAGVNGVSNQNARYAWLETAFTKSTLTAAPTGVDPLWWWLRADYYQGTVIGRIDVAATGSSSPVPPGMPQLPRPGEFYASPRLMKLLRSTPATQLGDRYPGHLVGTIGSSALPSPDSLIIVIGRSVADVAHQDGAELVSSISTTTPSQCSGGDCLIGVGTDYNGIVLILAVVAAALLFPVLIFVGGATRLSAARREQRFAAMRLVGATPRQVSVISTVESALATIIGAVAGIGLFFALRPVIATVPFTGVRFFRSDLFLTLTDYVFVLVGVPVGAAIAARLALRRVTISPLGVTRRVTPRAPRAWRLLPMAAGILELGYFAYVHDIGAGTRTNTTVEAVMFLIGILLVMLGLVVAGPWLTMLISRLVVRRANRPATLIAARRLADDPKAAFRAISGLVLAVFVGTCAIGVITAIASDGSTTGGLGNQSASTVIEQLSGPDRPHVTTAADDAARRALTDTAGVTGVAVIYSRPTTETFHGPVIGKVPGNGPLPGGTLQEFEQLVTCSDLAAVPALGNCPAGATAVAINVDYGGAFGIERKQPMRRATWPSAAVTPSQLRALPIDTIFVATDGSSAALEQARTVLDRAYPLAFPPRTSAEMDAEQNRLLDDYRRLADIVMLASLPIAGCSLAVNVAGGLIERKRPFSLLRLAGTPLGVLRRIVGLEAAAPLLITAAASVGTGFLAAQLFLRAQLHRPLVSPGSTYYLVLAAGLVGSLAVIASTLPLLRRITGPETARND